MGRTHLILIPSHSTSLAFEEFTLQAKKQELCSSKLLLLLIYTEEQQVTEQDITHMVHFEENRQTDRRAGEFSAELSIRPIVVRPVEKSTAHSQSTAHVFYHSSTEHGQLCLL